MLWRVAQATRSTGGTFAQDAAPETTRQLRQFVHHDLNLGNILAP